jgi:hypothetical protein
VIGVEHEFLAVCVQRHRSYMRLRLLSLLGSDEWPLGVCPRCGLPADLYELGDP